jgi:polysaccharide biosynthesis protein PslF
MTKDKPVKMCLIMVSGDFPPRISGVGDYAWHVVRTAATIGTSVTVITTKNNKKHRSSQVEYMDVRPIMDNWQFTEVKRVLQVLNESKINTVVNIQYNCPFTYGRRLLINFLPAIIRTLYPRIKIVVTMHGFWEQSLLFRLRALPMLRAAHGVIYVDRLNQALIRKYSGLAQNHLKFIPIAGNVPPIPCTPELRNSWRQELGLDDEDVAVAFFGGIGGNKGFEYLVEAIARVQNNYSLSLVLVAIGGFHSDLVGDSYRKEVLPLITKLGLDKHVRVFESLNSVDVSKYLHVADLAVYPFLNGVGENSGSMLAALAHGLPTVITVGPANDDGFAEKYGVVMVPAQDSEQLEKAIIKIVTSPALQQKLRKRALEISSQLDWKFVTRETMDFFASIF